jgi:hypothetical protein
LRWALSAKTLRDTTGRDRRRGDAYMEKVIADLDAVQGLVCGLGTSALPAVQPHRGLVRGRPAEPIPRPQAPVTDGQPAGNRAHPGHSG